MNIRARPCLLLLLATVVMLTACKRTPPSPWKEMTFPMDNAEILPGANQDKLTVMYRGTTQVQAYIREYTQSIEEAGYKLVQDGRDHDPTSHTYVHLFKKGDEKIRLSLQGGDGNLQVEVKKVDD